MDSISPAEVRTAGNHSGRSGGLTFFGKLMEGFGTTARSTSDLTTVTTTRARTYRRPSHTPERLAS